MAHGHSDGHWTFRTDVGRWLPKCSENENVRVKIITLPDTGVLHVSYSHFKPLKIFRQKGQKWRVDIQNVHWTLRTDVGRWLPKCSENENVRVKIITLPDTGVLHVSYSHFKPLKIFRQKGQKWRVDIQNGHSTFSTDVGRWLPKCSEKKNVRVIIITLPDKRVLDASYSTFKSMKIF